MVGTCSLCDLEPVPQSIGQILELSDVAKLINAELSCGIKNVE